MRCGPSSMRSVPRSTSSAADPLMSSLLSLALLMQAPLTVLGPPRAPVTVAVDWRVAPLALGRWRYRAVAGGSEAAWTDGAGTVQLSVICALATRWVVITRLGGGVPITLFTTGATRLLVSPSLAATDPLLDQIAFSRGRFAVAAPGAALLVVPSWAEPTRTIEDCRR